MTTETKSNARNFEAEVSQVLDLVINSLYSNKDIFLRELISNSADALAKLRFESLTNSALIADNEELKIAISLDAEAQTITIRDNGIGMNENDLISHLGTIAKSGTKEFIQTIKDNPNAGFNSDLIGQFGVGFYSAFIVASEVKVISRKAGEENYYLWKSQGKGQYEIETLTETDLEKYKLQDTKNLFEKFPDARHASPEEPELTNASMRIPKDEHNNADGTLRIGSKQGTTIILKLKDDEECKEYLSDWKIRSIVKKYSDFIEYPIKLETKDAETKEILWEVLNSQKAIWTRNKSEIKEEEYTEFYKHLSHDYNDPLTHIHYQAEGTNEFTALLYLPKKAPFDMFMPDNQKGLQLYINKVFISSEPELLLPQYLRFVKGLVDAKDLPLNVSRELLQQNPRVSAIKKNITKKVLSELENLKKTKKEEYLSFYQEFGKVIKEGVHTDYANKEKLLDLLLFQTTKTKDGEYISLQEYSDRAGSEAQNIYYITGESRSELENSPYLESLREKDVEVVFMTDAIDEWVVMSGAEFQSKHFKSVTKGDIEIDEKAKEETSAKAEEHKDLLAKLKDLLGNKVEEVRFSDRLVNTLCCLVAGEHDISANMERIYKNANHKLPESKRILELNSNHKVITRLDNIFKDNKADPKLKDYADLIYGQALLLEGSKIDNLSRFTQLISELMA